MDEQESKKYNLYINKGRLLILTIITLEGI